MISVCSGAHTPFHVGVVLTRALPESEWTTILSDWWRDMVTVCSLVSKATSGKLLRDGVDRIHWFSERMDNRYSTELNCLERAHSGLFVELNCLERAHWDWFVEQNCLERARAVWFHNCSVLPSVGGVLHAWTEFFISFSLIFCCCDQNWGLQYSFIVWYPSPFYMLAYILLLFWVLFFSSMLFLLDLLMWKIHVWCFREDWKPVLTINSIVYGLQYLFLEPNPEDPLNKEAAEVLQSNKRLFEQNVAKSMRGGHIGSMYFERCLKWCGGDIMEGKLFKASWTGSVLKQRFLVCHVGACSGGV